MKKKIIIISLICIASLIIGIFTFSSLNKKTSSKKENSNTKLETSKKKKDKVKETTKESKIDEDKSSNDDDSSDDDEKNNTNSTSNSSSSNNTRSNNNSNSSSNTNTESYNNNSNSSSQTTTNPTPSQPVSPPTEWERLGISEYDYYHSPAPNEGELAFRDSESRCASVASDITNRYSFVTNYGDVHSYSDDYIGCWIVVHLPNGSWIYYNEFLRREANGEFN